MNIKILLIAPLVIIFVGCGTIKSYNHLEQPTGKDLEAYIGGTIFKINRTRDLPNALGRADLYGGKIFAGYTQLRYQGLTDDGKLVLRVTEVETHSTETSMSRYGESTGTYQGNAYGNGYVSGSFSVEHPRPGSTEILPPNTAEFAFDTTKEKELVIAGVRVTFAESTPQSVHFRLATQP